MSVAHKIIEAHRTSDVLISENVDFDGLLLSDYVIKGLKNAGFQKPSPIQLKAIPLGRCGLDLVVQAKSGTGKTCVFSVVALESILVDSPAVQVLVLAPTREIAVQVRDVICNIGSAISSLQCHTFIGGMPLSEDKKNTKSCQIAIGTPGRVKQLIEDGCLKTTSIRLFILDEADKLLEESFQEQINWIYSALPENKQMLALSATYPEYLAQHLTRYMRNPTFIRLNVTDPALLGIKQYYKMVSFHSMAMQQFDNKIKAVVYLLSSITFQQCLVFSNLQTRAQNLSDELQSQGWPTACIAGFHDQKDRNEAMARLKAYKCRVLISTDLSARGIDADKVNLIINLDVPKDHETYLHRIGRAGRYGSFGAAVTIVSTGEEKSLKSLEQKCNTHIYPLPDPVPFDLVKIDLPISDIVSTEQIITRPTTCHQSDICQTKHGTPSDDVKHQVEVQPEYRISLDDEDNALTSEDTDNVLIHLPSHDLSNQSIQDSSQPLYNKIAPNQNSFSVDMLCDETEMKNDSNSFTVSQDILSTANTDMKRENPNEGKIGDPTQMIGAEGSNTNNGMCLLEKSLPSISKKHSEKSTFSGQNTETVISDKTLDFNTKFTQAVQNTENELHSSQKAKCMQESEAKDSNVVSVDTLKNVCTDFKEVSKQKYERKTKKSRSDNPNWRSVREDPQDVIHSSQRNKIMYDANKQEDEQTGRIIPIEVVQVLPSFAESIGHERVEHYLTYEAAKESLERFKHEDRSAKKLCLPDMIKTKIDHSVKSVDKERIAYVSQCLAKFHTEFKEKTLIRKTVLHTGISFSSDLTLKPVLKAQVEPTEKRIVSVTFPDTRPCVRPKSRKGNFMASLDSSPRQTAIQQGLQIQSHNLVQSLGDLKLDKKCVLDGSSESNDGYESDSSSSFSSLYEKDVYKNSYAAEPEILQNRQKVSTKRPSKLVLDGGPRENRPISEPAVDDMQAENNHQTFWSLGPYTDPKHPFHDPSRTIAEPVANDLEAYNDYRTRANKDVENEDTAIHYPYGEPESKKSNIHYPYGEGRFNEADAEFHGEKNALEAAEVGGTLTVHYPYGENPLASSEETSEHPEEELFYYKNVPPFGDPSVDWIQLDWQPDGFTNPYQQWDPNTQNNPYLYQAGYLPQTIPFPSYYPYPNPYYCLPQNYYPSLYPSETPAFYGNYNQWPDPQAQEPFPQRSETLEKLHIKLIKRQKAYIRLMSKQRH